MGYNPTDTLYFHRVSVIIFQKFFKNFKKNFKTAVFGAFLLED